jgi:hypothetical protein
MFRTAILAALVAAPVQAQEFWKPVAFWPVESTITTATWWVPPCDCGNCGDDNAQKKAYSVAYDKALKENKALVLFVGCPPMKLPNAVCVRYDKAELPINVKAPAILIGRNCGKALARTATLPGTASEKEVQAAAAAPYVCPTCPLPVKTSQAEFSSWPAMLAAAMVGATQEPCLGPECSPALQGRVPPMQVGTNTFGGGMMFYATSASPASDVYFTRRIRGPVRRLISAIRAARMARFAVVSALTPRMQFAAAPSQPIIKE